jgi:kynurenine 3-monooxygenase
MSESKVVIIGAGLAGSLLAIYLAKKGISVSVYEARGDMRLEEVAAGRSINLALSDRGIAALREIGMDEYMLAEAVPMYGRMIHTAAGDTKLLPYSGRPGEYINSVSRAGLNIALINEAEKYPAVTFYFNLRCVGFDRDTGKVQFSNDSTAEGDTVIATDGAGSTVRNAFLNGGVERFDYSQSWLEHGYKELHIPSLKEFDVQPLAIAGGSDFAMERNALHIWPRHQFMMIALPNFDGSYTCTLFLAHRRTSADDAAPCFEELTTPRSVETFFGQEFPDAVSLMPTLMEDFFHNPTGNLGTVKCFPWNAGGKALLLGDSAHAVVPFYGQGMNCAFEDVRVLDQLIERHGTDWELVFGEYGELRKANTDAIADMAEENFYEMRDAVADPVFVRKRELETRLEQAFPDYFSKYSMVTFREDLPYLVAKEKGNMQDRLLMEICTKLDKVDGLDLGSVIEQIREATLQ